MYPIEYPLWSLLARFGRRLTIRMDVRYDDEAGVYVATSKNLRGLICEADTMEDLKAEVDSVVENLVTFCVRGKRRALPVVLWPAT